MWERLAAALFVVAVLLGSADDVALAHGNDDSGTPVVTGGGGAYTGRLDRLVAGSKGASDQATSKSPARELPTKPAPEPRLSKSQWEAFLAMCLQVYGDLGCRETRDDREPDPMKAVVALDGVARTLIARLQLPDPTPRIGPDPSVNEWKMVAVGYPVWLWTDGPGVVRSTVRAYGVTFTLQATWVSTRFEMGDGHQVACTATRKYSSAVKAGSASPVCGYVYQRPSLPKGEYTVRATTNWRITWRALGQSGSLPGSYTGTRSLPVGELNALVVR